MVLISSGKNVVSAGPVSVNASAPSHGASYYDLGDYLMGLRLEGQTFTGHVTLQAPATAADNTLTLPNGNGSNGDTLITNGSGVLSFSSFIVSGQSLASSATVAASTNAGVLGPRYTIATGATLTVSTGSFFTVLS